jgi:hypothetical protein
MSQTSEIYQTGKVDGSGKIPERFENPGLTFSPIAAAAVSFVVLFESSHLFLLESFSYPDGRQSASRGMVRRRSIRCTRPPAGNTGICASSSFLL